MRLRTRSQYRTTVRNALRYHGSWIIADLHPSQTPFPRLGIIVTRRYGDAHQRNRFKRLVREAFRLLLPHFSSNFDIVVRPRSQALLAHMQDIQTELLKCVAQASTGDRDGYSKRT